MNESPELKQKAEEVCKNVKQIMEENAIDGPFVAEPGVDIFKDKGFDKRIKLVGARLYIGLVESGGVLPGKTDCYNACQEFNAGMNEYEKAMMLLCCYEAMSESNMVMMLKGKMNEKLGVAAYNPTAQQEPLV
jgi:hypothetical protein